MALSVANRGTAPGDTTRNLRRAVLLVAAVAAVAALVVPYATLTAYGIAGYSSKMACSLVIAMRRAPETVVGGDGELAMLPFSLAALRFGNDSVTATVGVGPWTVSRTAALRPAPPGGSGDAAGMGCVLLPATDALAAFGTAQQRDAALRAATEPAPGAAEPVALPAQVPPAKADTESRAWPFGDPTDTDAAAAARLLKAHAPANASEQLYAALDWAFSGAPGAVQTRSIAVVWRGHLIAERHAAGFDRETLHFGWSMGKSLLATLLGLRVKQGRLSLEEPVFAPEWHCGDDHGDDARTNITVDHLLRQSSGLAFIEDYARLAVKDVVAMLFVLPDAAHFAASQPLEYPIDTHWSYSSASSNLLSRHLRRSFAPAGTPKCGAAATTAAGDAEYWAYPREALFDRIGMRSPILEADAAGTFVLSSFDAATALDWARLGLLHLWDGRWPGARHNGSFEEDSRQGWDRLLPEGWVKRVTTPTPAAPEGRYGGHWWLNAGDGSGARSHPRLPPTTYHAHGFQEQDLMVIPTADLVIVRLGNGLLPQDWDEDEFGVRVLAALGQLE